MIKFILNNILIVIISFFMALLILSGSYLLITHSLIRFIIFDLKNGIIESIIGSFIVLLIINHQKAPK